MNIIKTIILRMGKGNFYISLALMSISIIFLVLSLSIKKGQVDGNNLSPAFFPFTLSLILLVLTILMIVSSLFSKKQQEEPTEKEQGQKDHAEKSYKNSILLMGFTFIYLILIPYLGFLLATTVYIFVIITYFKLLTWPKKIVFVGGILLFWYVIFEKTLLINFPLSYLGF